MTSFEPVAEWGSEPDPGSEHAMAELEEQQASEHLPERIEVGLGIYLVIHPDAFRRIMHNPEIEAMVDERGRELAEEANALAVIPDAQYVWWHSDNMENIRARGRVKPGNAKARLDDEWNSTLLKAYAAVGSDPYPEHLRRDPNYEGAQSYDFEGEDSHYAEAYPAMEAVAAADEGPEE
jgi:hypothetical protein